MPTELEYRRLLSRISDDTDSIVFMEIHLDTPEADLILAAGEPEGWVLETPLIHDEEKASDCLQLARVFSRLAARRFRIAEGITRFIEASLENDPISFYAKERFG